MTPQFKHIPFPTCEIQSETGDDGNRYYFGNWGRYPSVTTRLKWHYGTKWQTAWIKRVGEDEANAISGMAKRRGSSVHLLAERYVLNEPDWSRDAMPVNLEVFHRIKTFLDKNLRLVYGVEYPLWSSTLCTAGRTDVVGRWKGLDSIIDFKTARRDKEREQIESYFIQAACYALMVEERVGLSIPRIVIILAPEHSVTAQVYEDWVGPWREKVKSIFCKG